MYITRPLHIVSHSSYTENYMQVDDPKSERLITMTSLPVANNVQHTTLYSHCIYTDTSFVIYTLGQDMVNKQYSLNFSLSTHSSALSIVSFPDPSPIKRKEGLVF